jgi:hypothetical protein
MSGVVVPNSSERVEKEVGMECRKAAYFMLPLRQEKVILEKAARCS